MKILNVVTDHTANFKILFEVLKDMLTEVNIEFRSSLTKKQDKNEDSEDENDDDNCELEENNDEEEEDGGEEGEDKSENKNKEDDDCMKITALDPTKTVLIRVKLEGSNFDKFICKKTKLQLGVNLACFYKLIKPMGKSDILSLSVDHEKKNYLQIKIDSPDEKKVSEIDFKLLDLDEPKMTIPKIEFDAMITMDSQEFNRLCREMSNIADYVEIQCLVDKIIFICKGDFANKRTTYKTANANNGDDENENENDNILVDISHASTQSKNNNAPQIVQGIFELRKLVLFSKCASLCSDIEIYMKNDFPLVIKYTVASLGRILLVLTPIKEDTTKNANYSDEDEFYDSDEA